MPATRSSKSVKQAPSRPTLAEVAARLGVSRSTVSRSINGIYGPHRIAEETRARVIQAAKELGYRPDFNARALATRQTHQIGVLYRYSVPDMRGIYREIYQGVNEGLAKAGYRMLFVPLHGDDWAHVLDEQRIDGCLLSDFIDGPVLERLQRDGIPTVLLNLQGQGAVSEVVPDDADGVRLVMEHLHGLGHRSVVFARESAEGRVLHPSVRVREMAFLAEAERLGIAEQCKIVSAPMGSLASQIRLAPAAPGRDAAATTAVVCYSHFEATRLLQDLMRAGLSCPRDYSLICCDDVDLLGVLHPRVSGVRIPSYDIGHAAVKDLLEQIEFGRPGESPAVPNVVVSGPKRTVLPVELIARESTAALVAPGASRHTSV
jgi:LacI family transcriptional regulator